MLYSSSSKISTNADFSITSNEERLTPDEKYFSRASAHNVLSPAVNAAKCSSPNEGGVESRRISSNWLQEQKKKFNTLYSIKHTFEVHMVEVNYPYNT